MKLIRKIFYVLTLAVVSIYGMEYKTEPTNKPTEFDKALPETRRTPMAGESYLSGVGLIDEKGTPIKSEQREYEKKLSTPTVNASSAAATVITPAVIAPEVQESITSTTGTMPKSFATPTNATTFSTAPVEPSTSASPTFTPSISSIPSSAAPVEPKPAAYQTETVRSSGISSPTSTFVPNVGTVDQEGNIIQPYIESFKTSK